MAQLPEISLDGIEFKPSMHIDQYFGAWAVEPVRFSQMLNHIADINLAAHVELAGPLQERFSFSGTEGMTYDRNMQAYVTGDGTAVIGIQGTMTKYGSSFSTQGSTLQARSSVKKAAKNSDIKRIVLHVDSPGGSVAGIDDLAREIAKASKKKEVVAYAEDLMASAAYYISSQASKIYANPAANIGSIGVYTYLYDMSRLYENAGVRAIVVKHGEFKGAGIPGAEINEDVVAEIQRGVTDVAEAFIEAVSSGRKLSREQAEALATGQIWNTKDAQAKGLIDGVMDFDDLLGASTNTKNINSRKQMTADTRPAAQTNDREDNPMSESNTSGSDQVIEQTPKAATVTEIKEACPKADSDFILAQAEAGKTLEQARAAYIAKLEADAESAAKLDKASAESTKGVDTDVSGASATANVGDVQSLIDEEAKATGQSRHLAARRVFNRNPELREQYVAQHNAIHKKGN